MDADIGKKILLGAMDQWITPEINRRKHMNRITNDFTLEKAQIIFHPEKSKPKVRLNEEVKSCFKKENESPNFNITAPNDPNCGHITILKVNDKYAIGFDLRRNLKLSLEHIKASQEFLDSAKENLIKNRLRPFYDNLFSSAELLSTAFLLQLRYTNISKSKNHKDKIYFSKTHASLGNLKQRFSDSHYKLFQLRSSARYLGSTNYIKENHNLYVDIIQEEIEKLKKQIEN